MKKVLFVDEKFYRFSHYYEDKSWWESNDIIPKFKDYEKKNSKYLIYLSLFFDRPDYIVFVQLSTKNLILVALANLLRIRVVFWQHGLFEYPVFIKRILRKYPLKIYALLAFSEYDIKNISAIFKFVKVVRQIKHYDLSKISLPDKEHSTDILRIAYIGQIITSEQVFSSNAMIMEKYLGSTDYFSLIVESVREISEEIKFLVKPHPGDKSDYLEKLCLKFDFLELCESDEIYSADIAITHDSTLILAFFALEKKIIQLPYTDGSYLLDLSVYDQGDLLHRVNNAEDFLNIIRAHQAKDKNSGEQVQHYDSISTELLKIFHN